MKACTRNLRSAPINRASIRAELLTMMTQFIRQSGGDPRAGAIADWLDAWLDEPLQDLRGATPAQAMRSPGGRLEVINLLERMRGGLPA